MTAEERHLWYDFLKKLPIPVKRQKNIENYILDFYIPSAKLAIEIDGRQHKLAENRKTIGFGMNFSIAWGSRSFVIPMMTSVIDFRLWQRIS